MTKWFASMAIAVVATVMVGCSASRQTYRPGQKYPEKKLQEDYRIFRNVLEESHPSLYWFTPKDSMDYYFNAGYDQLDDSMTEPEFRKILSFVTNKIHCGHTTVKPSKQYNRFTDTAQLKIFPLSFKVWPDYMVVTGNLTRDDYTLRRGTIVTGIDGYSVRQLTDTFSNYLSYDGYSENGKLQVLSNRGTFGALYQSVLGQKDSYTINYIDQYGLEQQTIVPVFTPFRDTTKVKKEKDTTGSKPSRPRQVFFGSRYVQIDTTLSSAYMTVHTFARGNKLRSFFRKAFRVMDERKIKNLVIDVRSNGGGDAGIATMLTRYIADSKFKIADSLYAVKRTSKYSRYIKLQPLYWAMMQFVTSRHRDGNYHFGFFERHYFKPKKKHHFDGDVYIIIGGNSFSATTVFAKILQGQENVTIIGEETGGGSYGNSAWMIPDVVLPNTKVRFRLPKFRLVMDENLVKEGRGIIPDIEVGATIESIRKGVDPKVELVRKLILQKNGMAHQ